MAIRVGVKLPEEISDLYLDIDPHALTNVDGDLITQLVDKIHGNNLIQTDPLKKMVFRTNQQNGFASVNKELPDANRYYDFGTGAIENLWAGDVTLFVAAYITGAASNILLNSGAYGTSKGGFLLDVSPGGAFYWELRGDSPLQSMVSQSIQHKDQASNVICVNIKRGGSSYFKVNNTRTLMSASTPAYSMSAYANNIRFLSSIAYSTGAYGLPAPFKLYRILIYNRALTEKEEAAVCKGLQLKYKI